MKKKNGDHAIEAGDISQEYMRTDAVGHVSIAVRKGNRVIDQPSNILSSTLCSKPSTSMGFGTNELSGISINSDEHGLCEPNLNLNIHLVPAAEEQYVQPSSPSMQSSEYRSGPLSLGYMVPNMSLPENMIDIADRELLKISNTI